MQGPLRVTGLLTMRMRDTTLLEFDDGEDVDGFAAKCAARAEVANHVLRQDTESCV